MDAIEAEEFMRIMASAIEESLAEAFEQKMGFALFCFEFGKPGISNYISNADRSDMIKALKETIKRFENGEFMPAIIGGKQ